MYLILKLMMKALIYGSLNYHTIKLVLYKLFIIIVVIIIVIIIIDDPYQSAETFIINNNLPSSYLDQVM